ncbi:hypothetical protein K1719_024619 [Acacia pycnantha]|nr:hypothetical protein K1719_024619 [Acacia pycnantha]
MISSLAEISDKYQRKSRQSKLKNSFCLQLLSLHPWINLLMNTFIRFLIAVLKISACLYDKGLSYRFKIL